ncbi:MULTISPECIES: hypothetical protein [Pectobacterium]|uniref:hypothetical protein n=1 Tax=Pectobacterium TaxID=122277 RepID=UPI0018651342|nr:hypothetical protein [Pectobacterium polaris]
MSLNNYPLIKLSGRNFLLSIYPEWHTRLFPESILNNESSSIIEDVSHTNSIHKVYLAGMRGMETLRPGDNILIYRTGDGQGAARFRSVATSVCVIEDVRNIHEFSSLIEFKNYCAPHSVFTDKELTYLYNRKHYPIIIKFTYNFALNKRIIRNDLMNITGYTDSDYWGFMQLSDPHFRAILSAGEVNESLIVN